MTDSPCKLIPNFVFTNPEAKDPTEAITSVKYFLVSPANVAVIAITAKIANNKNENSSNAVVRRYYFSILLRRRNWWIEAKLFSKTVARWKINLTILRHKITESCRRTFINYRLVGSLLLRARVLWAPVMLCVVICFVVCLLSMSFATTEDRVHEIMLVIITVIVYACS